MEPSVSVSIIVPVYNVENYLGKCVNSLRNQTYKNIEIILIDDGSTDHCPQMCEDFTSLDCRIKAVHKANGGASSARKAGLSMALGDYIMFVDGDDWIDIQTVQCCVEAAIKERADCVLFSYVREYEDRSLPNLLFERDYQFDSVDSENKIHRRLIGPVQEELKNPQKLDNFSSVCMKLYRRDVAKKGRIVSERVIGSSEDTVFNLYALDGCRNISYINSCFYHYRKTNVRSLTSQYKSDLVDKWDKLYEIFEEYISATGNLETYREAFLNRIACGVIGLGLNEINAPKSFAQKSKSLRVILQKPLYREALKQLNIHACPIHWKLFFTLCKTESCLLLTILLLVINQLRSKVAG